MGCILFFACQGPVDQNKTPLTNKFQTDKSQLDTTIIQESIPSIFMRTLDSGFMLHQDTLYFNNEKFNGHSYLLFPSKDTAFVGTYVNGLEEGMHKKWYFNKQVRETRTYHKGKKVGTHIGYWENGKKKFEFEFRNGEHHGMATEWYQTGQLYKKFNYVNGYEEGSQKMWWENGVIKANYAVKKGRRYGLIGLKLCMNPSDSMSKQLK